MIKKALVIAAMLALPLGAAAESKDQLVERYTALAGSKQNATSVVNGLRDGKEVKLTDGKTTTTFKPATDKMGYGNVDNALALAEASLKEKGITNPTPAQLQASVQEILKMRADGRGWGEIANSMGFKLGDLKRSEKAERVAKTERAHRPEKPERPQRPERPEKPERHHK